MIDEVNLRRLAQLVSTGSRGLPAGAVGSPQYRTRLALGLLAFGINRAEVVAFAERLKMSRNPKTH